MSKFFFKREALVDGCVAYYDSVAHHMINVLRLQLGEEVILCDGEGTDYKGRVDNIIGKPAAISFTILSSQPSQTEPPFPITLFQGLPKSDKMDWIIEKCIEAGVTKIIPVATARSVAKIKDASSKAQRFARIAESAASQSMRGIIPVVFPPISFNAAIAEISDADLCLVAYEDERERSLKSALTSRSPRPVSLWIGPEGGFENSEIAALQEKKDAIPISLGPRILRTETAGIVAISQILCLWS